VNRARGGRPPHRAAVRHPCISSPRPESLRRRRLEQRLRFAVLSFAPLAIRRLVLDSFLSWLVVGSILSLTRVLTGNIAWHRTACGWWWCGMLQEATVSGSSPAYSAWVGRFDGLLAIGCCPGITIAAALWSRAAPGSPMPRTEVVEPLNGIVEFQTQLLVGQRNRRISARR